MRAGSGSFSPDLLTDETLGKIRALNEIAEARGQTLAQMALAWTLRDSRVTSTLVGASSVAQLEENLAALDSLAFTEEELAEIDRHASDSGINLWAESSRPRSHQYSTETRYSPHGGAVEPASARGAALEQLRDLASAPSRASSRRASAPCAGGSCRP